MRSSYTVLSLPPQPGGEDSHDDRTGRIYACLSMGQAGARRYTHHCGGNRRLGGAVSPARPTRYLSCAGPCLAGRPSRLRPVVSPAGAALVGWSGVQSSDDQSGPHPPGVGSPDGRPPRGGGPGHHPSGAVGSLAGWHRRGRPHAPDWLGGHPLSLAEGTLPDDDAGTYPAAPAGLSSRRALDAGGRPRLSQRRALRPVA